MNKAKELIDNWTKVCLEMERAIAERNYRNFILSLRAGSKYFRQMQKKIVDGSKGQFLEYEDDVRNLINKWLELSEKLKPWMKEIEQKIENNKRNIVKDRKIGKAYAFMKTTGRNVKIKAR